MFDASSGAIITEYEVNSDCLTVVAFTPDQKQVVIITVDGGLRVYDKISGVLIYELEGHTSTIVDIAIRN